ncbi:hypothetical protein [Patulibacter minatonensis]|uniref:hypothetical protein n=1 Tax=Patulibacter minatonensis TaxID=298163 RepID=UPI00047D5AB9|nr:hypothetical protein [Patulibacter minatonensis]
MKRVVTGVLCIAVPFLAACGGGTTTGGPDPGTPGPDDPLPTTTAADADVAPTTTVRTPPPALARARPTVMVPGDPCEGTPGERVRRRARERRRHVTRGFCAEDQPGAHVAGRHEPLSFLGTTTRLRSIVRSETVPNPNGGDALRPPTQDSVFITARVTVGNRRPRSLTLPRGSITVGLRSAVAQTFIWSVSGPGASLGPDRPEIRIPAHARRTLGLVWTTGRTGPQLTDSGARLLLEFPDPPGAPKHPKQPARKTSSGVVVLDR